MTKMNEVQQWNWYAGVELLYSSFLTLRILHVKSRRGSGGVNTTAIISTVMKSHWKRMLDVMDVKSQRKLVLPTLEQWWHHVSKGSVLSRNIWVQVIQKLANQVYQWKNHFCTKVIVEVLGACEKISIKHWWDFKTKVTSQVFHLWVLYYPKLSYIFIVVGATSSQDALCVEDRGKRSIPSSNTSLHS